jgi:hypothetical protein
MRPGVTGAARWLGLCVLIGVLGALVVGGATAATGTTRYVSSTGDNTDNDCTDSSNPCATVQFAVNQADEGDTIDIAGTIDDNASVRISLTITQWPGQAAAVLDGSSGSDTVLTVDGSDSVDPPTVTLSDLTIENGFAGGVLQPGGGVYNNDATLTVENSSFSNNFAGGFGGGIDNYGGGTLTVENSTFSGNTAAGGGGISNEAGGTLSVENSAFSANSASEGGALLEFGTGTGTVVRSTFSGNSAVHNGAGIDVEPDGTLVLADSTLTGNSSGGGGGAGGAVWNQGAITVESSTIAGNSAPVGSAIAGSGGGSVTLAGDILAEPTAGSDCDDIGDLADDGYNLDDDGTCISSTSPGTGSHNGTTALGSSTYGAVLDAYLADSLAANGGPTQTLALLNSPSPTTTEADPALGVVPQGFDLPVAVDSESAACAVPDQRGVTPAAGIGCDIGAYLLQPTATGLGTSSASVKPGVSVTYTATVTPTPDGGTVKFSDGAGNPATANCAVQPLTGDTATCTVAYPAHGDFSVTATYAGDGVANDYAASTSAPPLTQSVVAAPEAPTAVSASAGDQQATVNFTAPSSNGAAITGYIVTASPGGRTGSGSGSPISVTGLSDGTTYTFTVTATNGVGTGGPSAASNAVTPRDTHAPSAPTGLGGRIASNSLRLSWRPSSDNVGVDHYEVYRDGSPIKEASGASSQVTFRSFNGRGPTVFTVRAFDAAGNRSDTNGEVTVKPVARPKSVPKHVPSWAWKLLAWQRHHTGAKPVTPKPLPAWYAVWKSWRSGLYRLVG